MANENPEVLKLLQEFEQLTREIDELLEDLKWRRPDWEEEMRRFQEAMEKRDPEGMGYVASMQPFIQIWTAILEEKEAQLREKAKRWEELRKKVVELTGQEIPPLPKEIFDEAVRKETE
jgi:flagellar motility protein MotE (MotC chaperone)